MYNCPRAATVKCTASGVLWALDRATFRTILCSKQARRSPRRRSPRAAAAARAAAAPAPPQPPRRRSPAPPQPAPLPQPAPPQPAPRTAHESLSRAAHLCAGQERDEA